MTCLEKFNKDVKEIVNLCSTLGVTEVHAGCYLCNFEDEYICHTHGGVCKEIARCREIREKLPYVKTTQI